MNVTLVRPSESVWAEVSLLWPHAETLKTMAAEPSSAIALLANLLKMLFFIRCDFP